MFLAEELIQAHIRSSSAVIAIGAATLADIFEPAERGTKVRTRLLSRLILTRITPNSHHA